MTENDGTECLLDLDSDALRAILDVTDTDELYVKRRAVAWYLLACRGQLKMRLYNKDEERAAPEVASRASVDNLVSGSEADSPTRWGEVWREACGIAGAFVILEKPNLAGKELWQEVKLKLTRDFQADKRSRARSEKYPTVLMSTMKDFDDIEDPRLQTDQRQTEQQQTELRKLYKRIYAEATEIERAALRKRLLKHTLPNNERQAIYRLKKRLRQNQEYITQYREACAVT